MHSVQNEKIAIKVSIITIVGNMVLSIFKFIAGFAGASSAMVSDAAHSASDVFSTFVVIIGVKISGKDADESHPYGHERFECVAAIILAVILCFTGIGIGYSAILKIGATERESLPIPGLLALLAAVISIISKEAMYWYTRAAAKKINSGALMADAWHHRSDALSSIGSLAGILGARLGFPILDPLAGLVICIFVIKAAMDIFMDAVKKMTDTSCGAETDEEIRRLVDRQEGVLGIDMIKTRIFGDKIYVDIEIKVKGDLFLTQAHDIAEMVHDEVEKKIQGVKHCMVHVNPCVADWPNDARGD